MSSELENVKLKAALVVAVNALSYYADKEWDTGCGCCQKNFDPVTNPAMDEGRTAQEALKELKNMYDPQ